MSPLPRLFQRSLQLDFGVADFSPVAGHHDAVFDRARERHIGGGQRHGQGCIALQPGGARCQNAM
eukprot:1193739-Lingulodinium_polyedra.AAC.1